MEILYLSKFDAASDTWVSDWDDDKVASALGLNFDAETNVMYKTNKQNGVLIEKNASNPAIINLYLYMNGAKVSTANIRGGNMSTNINKAYMNITSLKNTGVAFGLNGTSDTASLMALITQFYTLDDPETKVWGYLLSSGHNGGALQLLLETGELIKDTQILQAQTRVATSQEYVSLAPFMTNDGLTADGLYFAIVSRNCADILYEFTGNGKTYSNLRATGRDGNRMPVIFEI